MKRGEERIFVFLSLIVFLSLLISISFVSASLEQSFSEVEKYIQQYDSEEITAPQLIVYIDYSQNKMYESSSEERISETEVKKFFEKVEQNKKFNEFKGFEYEKKFFTKDFHIIFRAYPYVRHDKEYYESREEEENYYFIDYQLVSAKDSGLSLSLEIRAFISDLEQTLEESEFDYKEFQEKFSRIKNSFQRTGKCEEILKELGFSEQEKKYQGIQKEFYFLIKEKKDEKCWTNPKCEQKCEIKKDCFEREAECSQKDVCEEVCEEVPAEDSNETNETRTECKQECNSVQECEEPVEECKEYQECHDECKDEEKCEEFTSGELRIGANCNEDFSDLYINAWGDFEKYQTINEGGKWNCDTEIQSLTDMRKALQEDINNNFVKWYFEEFLNQDYDKIINGERGLEEVFWRLIKIEEEIAGRLYCSETGEWPEGFEKIDINYSNENVHVELWEKNIPVEMNQGKKYYTTLFKYSWFPSKEFAKGLIQYVVQNKSLGPSAKDVSKIKADEGQMALITSLSKRYGGSFDVKMRLREKDGDFDIEKYLQINPDAAVKLSDAIEEKEDISIEVDYDVLYNLIKNMHTKFEGEKIKGPYWVRIEEDSGPGEFFSVLGAVSSAWKEGVKITPRYALIKLFFNAKSLKELLLGGSSTPQDTGKEQVKMSGEAVSER